MMEASLAVNTLWGSAATAGCRVMQLRKMESRAAMAGGRGREEEEPASLHHPSRGDDDKHDNDQSKFMG